MLAKQVNADLQLRMWIVAEFVTCQKRGTGGGQRQATLLRWPCEPVLPNGLVGLYEPFGRYEPVWLSEHVWLDGLAWPCEFVWLCGPVWLDWPVKPYAASRRYGPA